MAAVGGGTGGGLGCAILDKIRETYLDRCHMTVNVFPSTKVSDCVTEAYNAVLSTHWLVENADLTFCIDNQALYDISKLSLRINSPTYGDLNHLVSTTLSSVTASMRFRGDLNSDLRKLAVNLVPFPRVHFASAGFASFATKDTSYIATVPELTEQMFKAENNLCSIELERVIYLTASSIFRGQVSAAEVALEM